MTDPRGFQVNCRLCKTCIFTDRSPIPPERFAELKAEWERRSVVQQCHASSIEGGDVACRGAYEAFKRGEIANHPVRRIADEMGLGSLDAATIATVYERMGLIEFVEVGEGGESQ